MERSRVMSVRWEIGRWGCGLIFGRGEFQSEKFDSVGHFRRCVNGMKKRQKAHPVTYVMDLLLAKYDAAVLDYLTSHLQIVGIVGAEYSLLARCSAMCTVSVAPSKPRSRTVTTSMPRERSCLATSTGTFSSR